MLRNQLTSIVEEALGQDGKLGQIVAIGVGELMPRGEEVDETSRHRLQCAYITEFASKWLKLHPSHIELVWQEPLTDAREAAYLEREGIGVIKPGKEDEFAGAALPPSGAKSIYYLPGCEFILFAS